MKINAKIFQRYSQFLESKSMKNICCVRRNTTLSTIDTRSNLKWGRT